MCLEENFIFQEGGAVPVKDLSLYVFAKLERIGHLKLQKLIYYIDAWHMVYFDKPLISNDFEAWVHGPVVREMWDFYKNRLPLFDELRFNEYGRQRALATFKVSDSQSELIDDVLEEYGDKTAYYLEVLTHSESPWREARRGLAPLDITDRVISKKTMQTFYASLLDEKI